MVRAWRRLGSNHPSRQKCAQGFLRLCPGSYHRTPPQAGQARTIQPDFPRIVKRNFRRAEKRRNAGQGARGGASGAEPDGAHSTRTPRRRKGRLRARRGPQKRAGPFRASPARQTPPSPFPRVLGPFRRPAGARTVPRPSSPSRSRRSRPKPARRVTACHPVEAVPPEAHRRGSEAETVEVDGARNAAGRAESGPANAPHAQRLTPGARSGPRRPGEGERQRAGEGGRAGSRRRRPRAPSRAPFVAVGAVEVEAGAPDRTRGTPPDGPRGAGVTSWQGDGAERHHGPRHQDKTPIPAP